MSEDDEWRAQLDVALDAMKLGSASGAWRVGDGKAIAEKIFDELDELHPGWHFEVPMRARHRRRSPEIETRRVLAAMLSWEGWGDTAISRVFGVSGTTAHMYIVRGERMLLNPRLPFAIGHRGGIFRPSYDRQYLDRIRDPLPMLEEDLDSAEQRLYHRWLAAGTPDTPRAVAWIARGLNFDEHVETAPVGAQA